MNSAINVLNDVPSLQGRNTVFGTRAAGLATGPSAALSQIARDAPKFRQAHVTISTESKELAKIEQLNRPNKRLENNVAF